MGISDAIYAAAQGGEPGVGELLELGLLGLLLLVAFMWVPHGFMGLGYRCGGKGMANF